MSERTFAGSNISQEYLRLLKLCLTFLLYAEDYLDVLENGELRLIKPKEIDLEQRIVGADWPGIAATMIGLRRLDNLQFCVEDVLANSVPGDLIECGTWRGGASIFIRGVLKAHSVTDRCMWVADSFEGLPAPNVEKCPADIGSNLHTFPYLAVSLEQVKKNFECYGLLDHQVQFLKGWFCDTLPRLSSKKWSVIRLDGDMYESTIDALDALYPNLSCGGYIIIDDYGCIPACRKAIDDYRQAHRIVDEIHQIDWTGVYWQRS